MFSNDFGLYAFAIPDDPAAARPRRRIGADGAQEGIDAADLDGDGLIDLVGSSHRRPDEAATTISWWRNPGTATGEDWVRQTVGTTRLEADRIRVVDINGDGRPDIVATGSDPAAGRGELYWFEQTAGQGWVRHIVATGLGALESMDAGDVNRNGRIDIVTGEHRGAGPLRTVVWENIDDGRSWTAHLVDAGKESHMGVQLADLDGDGDLDIVSIAYDTHRIVHLWRNDAVP